MPQCGSTLEHDTSAKRKLMNTSGGENGIRPWEGPLDDLLRMMTTTPARMRSTSRPATAPMIGPGEADEADETDEVGGGSGAGTTGGDDGDSPSTTACGAERSCCTEVVTPSPSAAKRALRATWSDAAVARTPVESVEAAKVAPASDAKKMSAFTSTDPAVSVRRTALVLTSAAAARTVLMAVCAAAS